MAIGDFEIETFDPDQKPEARFYRIDRNGMKMYLSDIEIFIQDELLPPKGCGWLNGIYREEITE